IESTPAPCRVCIRGCPYLVARGSGARARQVNMARTMKMPLDGFYEGLSEHSHPNISAMFALYTEKNDDAVTVFSDRDEGRGRATMIGALAALTVALGLVELAYDQWDEHHALAMLCEEHIFEKGEWPTNQGIPGQTRREQVTAAILEEASAA